MRNSKKGFTIIEVVLVLAIGGLIFLMVFIALPALQRSQRDTQRKDDLARFMSATIEYQKHNSGKTPFDTNQFDTQKRVTTLVTHYIDNKCEGASTSDGRIVAFKNCGDQFTDPNGETYNFLYLGTTDPKVGWLKDASADSDYKLDEQITNLNTIYVTSGTKCGTQEGSIRKVAGLNHSTILMRLESGAIACQDNS